VKRAVVDTNVPIVANGRTEGTGEGGIPSVACRLAAIDFLLELMERGKLMLDLAHEIQGEYRRHLNPSGQPGVGDRFYQEVLRRGPPHVQRVELPKLLDGSYQDYPTDETLAAFDPSDRKFVALSRRTRTPVVVATDSDWVEHRAALTRNGVEIMFLCGADPKRWFSS
jgi:hypothetical protein